MTTYSRKNVVVIKEAVTVPTRVTGDKNAKAALETAASHLDKKIQPMLNTIADSKDALRRKQSGQVDQATTTPAVGMRHGGR